MIIIIALIITLVIIVVVINVIQQRKEAVALEKRTQVAKQKAIIDETEGLLLNLANLPNNPTLVDILNNRNLSAAKTMASISPENKALINTVKELEERVNSNKDNKASSENELNFTLPDNEQQLITLLQSIKKLRVVLKSEQNKGRLDAQTFSQEELKLSAIQLKIGVESLQKRGNAALKKEMFGSARQYFDKALQTINKSPVKTDYCQTKQEEITTALENITSSLKTNNAKDAAKKAEKEKKEDGDIDMLFQPKKKW